VDSPQRKPLILFIIFLAGVLTFFVWTRLQASLIYLPVDTALNRHHAGESIPSSQLPSLIDKSDGALETFAHYRYREGLAKLHYMGGLDESRLLHDRLSSFKASRQASIEVLSQAPAKPATWLRLARINAILQLPSEDVISPLLMSIHSGAVEPTLFQGRLELGYRFADEMNNGSLAMLRQQTRLAWTLRKNELIAAVKSGTINPETLRALMSETDPVLANEMEAEIARRR
jgi:hypothetical protein